MIGSGSLLNGEVYKIGLTWPGLIGMLIIMFLAVVILFIEFGVVITIAQKRYFQKEIFIAEAFVTTLKKLPKLMGFGIFLLAPVFLLFVPLIDSSFLPVLLDYNIPIILTSQVYGSIASIIVYSAGFILALYLFVKWIFTLHLLFIEEKHVWEAIKESWNMTSKNTFKIMLSLILVNLGIYISGFGLVSFFSFLAGVLDQHIIGSIVEEYLIAVSSFITLIISLLLIPVNSIITTRLFYQAHDTHGREIEDHLKIAGNRSLNNTERSIGHFFEKRKYLLLSLTFLYLTGFFVVNYTINDNLVFIKWDVAVASHRGDMQAAPENSMSSIQSALDKGVDAVEIDVRMTKDGIVVLNHDIDLQRTAGVPLKISEMTYEEVREIDIGYLHSEEFAGERIPTFNEVAELMKEENATLIVDIKPYESGELLATKVANIIEKHEIAGKSYVQSFDYNVLQAVRKSNSEIKIGQIIYLAAGNLSSLDVDFYTIRKTMLSEHFVRNAHRQNREVWVWTVNLERNMREVLEYDIDGIITDYPTKLQNVLGISLTQEAEEESGEENDEEGSIQSE